MDSQTSLDKLQRGWPLRDDIEMNEVKKETESTKDNTRNGAKLWMIFLTLVLSILLVALDTTILATAIPQITDEFKSLDQVGWYGSAYFLTYAAFQSVWGKVYTYFNTKATFSIGIGIFEVGATICAISNSSTMLIAGRAITGVGGAALASGAFSIVAKIAEPRKRPMYIGFIGATFAVASVIGPVLGGFFTEYAQGLPYSGWRLCFWVQLPIGAIATFIILLFFNPPPSTHMSMPLREKLLHMDLPGAAALLAAMVCFLLPMRWGGVLLPWSSGQVIGTLEGSMVCLLIFILIEWRSGEKAMMQWRLFKNYQIVLNLVYMFFLNGLYMPAVYFISIQFQALEDKSPAQAGIQLIPLVLCVSLGSIIANTSITKYGRPGIWQLSGPILSTAGMLMIYQMGSTADSGSWIFFQIVLGFGTGFSLQTPMSIQQSLVDPEDISIVVGMTLFFEMCGASLLIAACEATFANQLVLTLQNSESQLEPVTIVESGASQLRSLLSGSDLDAVLQSYQQGLSLSYLVMFLCGCITILISFLLLVRSSSRKMLFSN